MEKKVFRIPDGKGGFSYQVQTPEGEWQTTDAAGNPLPKEEPAHEKVPSGITPQARRLSKKAAVPYKDLPYVNFSMRIPKDDYEVLSSYISWKRLKHQECSRAAILLKVGLDFIHKDKDYKEFMNKNGHFK